MAAYGCPALTLVVDSEACVEAFRRNGPECSEPGTGRRPSDRRRDPSPPTRLARLRPYGREPSGDGPCRAASLVARGSVGGGSGGIPPARVFVKQKHIWLLHKPEKQRRRGGCPRKPDPAHSLKGRFIDRAKVA